MAYLSTKHLFELELAKLVKTEIERLRDVIASGSAVSFDDYKFIAGRINGLRTALEYMEEANANLEKDS